MLFSQEKDIWHPNQFFESFFEEIYTQFAVEKLDEYFTEGALIMENGAIYSLESFGSKVEQMKLQFEEEAKNGYTFNRKNHLEIIDFKHHKETIWISLKNSANYTIGENSIAELNSLASAVLILEDGLWKIQMFHTGLIN